MLGLLKVRLVIFMKNLTGFLCSLRSSIVYIGKNIILKFLKSIIATAFLMVIDFVINITLYIVVIFITPNIVASEFRG